jgi:hypothetical protein
VPRRGDVLVGRQGAVLSGSKVLTTWRKDGKAWSATGFLPAAPGTHGECAASAPTCTYTQDVFVDKRRLVRVASRSAVTAGTVYADYRTGTITIGTDPRSHLVEQAVAPGLIRATVDDVTVANLVLEEAANQAQTGAVESREVSRSTGGGTGWRILHNDVRLNHGVGVGGAGGSTVAGNVIHHQGQLGFGAHGKGSVITNNEIAYNIVRANNNGITLIDSGNRAREWPTPHGPHIVQNVWVHDNTVTMSAHQTTGAVEDDQDTDIFTTNHNRFDSNTYEVDSIAAPHFSWDNVNVDWVRWRGYGHDRHGRAGLLDSFSEVAGGVDGVPRGDREV